MDGLKKEIDEREIKCCNDGRSARYTAAARGRTEGVVLRREFGIACSLLESLEALLLGET